MMNSKNGLLKAISKLKIELIFSMIALVPIIAALLFFKKWIIAQETIKIITIYLLFITFLAIVLYTIYTRRQALTSEAELKARYSPILSLAAYTPDIPYPMFKIKHFDVIVRIQNMTINHTYCFLKTSVQIWGEMFNMQNEYYNGNKIWYIPAGGFREGHFSIIDILQQKSKQWYIERLESFVKSEDSFGYSKIKKICEDLETARYFSISGFPVDIILMSTAGIKISYELSYFKWDLKLDKGSLERPLSEWSESDRSLLISHLPVKYYLQLMPFSDKEYKISCFMS